MPGCWTVDYHPGRQQPYTIRSQDGTVERFCAESCDVETFLTRREVQATYRRRKVAA